MESKNATTFRTSCVIGNRESARPVRGSDIAGRKRAQPTSAIVRLDVERERVPDRLQPVGPSVTVRRSRSEGTPRNDEARRAERRDDVERCPAVVVPLEGALAEIETNAAQDSMVCFAQVEGAGLLGKARLHSRPFIGRENRERRGCEFVFTLRAP